MQTNKIYSSRKRRKHLITMFTFCWPLLHAGIIFSQPIPPEKTEPEREETRKEDEKAEADPETRDPKAEITRAVSGRYNPPPRPPEARIIESETRLEPKRYEVPAEANAEPVIRRMFEIAEQSNIDRSVIIQRAIQTNNPARVRVTIGMIRAQIRSMESIIARLQPPPGFTDSITTARIRVRQEQVSAMQRDLTTLEEALEKLE